MAQPTNDVAAVFVTETAGAVLVPVLEEEADYSQVSPTGSVDDALDGCADPLEQHADNCSADRTVLTEPAPGGTGGKCVEPAPGGADGKCVQPDRHDPTPPTVASPAPSAVPAPGGGDKMERSLSAVRQLCAIQNGIFMYDVVPIVLHTCSEDATNTQMRLENVLQVASVRRDSQNCIDAGRLRRGGSLALWVFRVTGQVSCMWWDTVVVH
jgi:hypothetical protein